MEMTIKCAQCGGTKCTSLGNNTFRCMYCGSTFQVHEELPTPPPAPPVNQQSVTPQPVNRQPMEQPRVVYVQQAPPVQPNPEYVKKYNRNRGVALLLSVFLGGFGIQHFYLGKMVVGILCVIFCWTYIPAIIGFVDFIRLLLMSDREFDERYNC